MPLNQETIHEIRSIVRGGFEERARIIEIFREEMYAPGELNEQEIEFAVDEEIKAHEAEKSTWPTTTDCDRLDAAFVQLNEAGIISLHNAGYTQSDGYDDFKTALSSVPNPECVIGYCFYHGQDLERAVAGQGLFLAFGPTNPREEETNGTEVGQRIAKRLIEAGLRIEWNGAFNSRIQIHPFDWKRRELPPTNDFVPSFEEPTEPEIKTHSSGIFGRIRRIFS
jgi:hypothetical protein